MVFYITHCYNVSAVIEVIAFSWAPSFLLSLLFVCLSAKILIIRCLASISAIKNTSSCFELEVADSSSLSHKLFK